MAPQVWPHCIYTLSTHSRQYLEPQDRNRQIFRKEVWMWKPVSICANFGQLHGLDHSTWPSEITGNGENSSLPQQWWGSSLTVDHGHLQIHWAWLPPPARSGLAYFPYLQLTVLAAVAWERKWPAVMRNFPWWHPSSWPQLGLIWGLHM